MASVEGEKSDEYKKRFSKWLEDSAGISQKLLDSLDDDDDWTFVIKMHGILEVGLNHLILSRLTEPRAAKIVSHLETNNDRRGKLAFLKAYGLLPEKALLLVKLLSDVRNVVVHDIKNFNFDLEKYLHALNKTEQNHWIDSLSWWVDPPLISEWARKNLLLLPREWINVACITILAKSFQESTYVDRFLEAFYERVTPKPPEESTPTEP